MTPCIRRTTIVAIIIGMVLPVWGGQYLYAPQPVTPPMKTTSQEGILVQEVEVRKGDTLYGLSRKLIGRGMYYPQILLFNSIKNPDLIYPGHTLRVPVTHKEASDAGRSEAKPAAPAAAKATGSKKTTSPTPEPKAPIRPSAAPAPVSNPTTELSLSDLKTVGTEKNKTGRNKKKTAVQVNKNAVNEPVPATISSPRPPAAPKSIIPAVPVTNTTAKEKLFEAAEKSYRRDDCRSALELLDRFLAENPDSPRAADANLYKADCYLKLSTQ